MKIIPNKYICNIDNKGSQLLANTMGSNKIFILGYSLFNMPQSQIKEQYPDLIIKLVFQRLTPTFEPLPEEIQTQYKALKSYYHNTVINTNCWTSLNYEVSLQSFIEETYQKINEININNNKLLL